MWDYCTPSEFSADRAETQSDPEDEGLVINEDDNGSLSRPNAGGQKTALYNQTDCDCKKMMIRTSTCDCLLSDMYSVRISQHTAVTTNPCMGF